jgi:hypothetical protein
MRSVLEMDGSESNQLTNTLDTIADVSMPVRLLTLLKQNRLEMMIVTILLYSTGLLTDATTYAQGVC